MSEKTTRNRQEKEAPQNTSPPENLSQAFLRIVWKWKPLQRNIILIIAALIGGIYILWLGSTDNFKDTLLSYIIQPSATPTPTTTSPGVSTSNAAPASSNQTQPSNNLDKITLLAEFILDEKGNPKIEREYIEEGEKVYGYWIRLSLTNFPPGVASVTYDPNDSEFDDIFLGSGPDFKAEFHSYGRLDMIVKLIMMDGVENIIRGKSLLAALQRSHAGDKDPEIRKALKQFENH